MLLVPGKNIIGSEEIVMMTMDTSRGYILFLRHLVIGAWKYMLKIKEVTYEPRGTAARGIGVGFYKVPL